MSNPEQDASKTNGLASNPVHRLPSFKPPRDLTLGGAKPNKKVFTPNLNVARNKNKGPAVPNLNNSRNNDRGKRDRKNDRNRNLKNGPSVIKSSGVFSEGLGAVERQASRGSYGRSGDSDTTATLQKPTIRIKDAVKIDKELEERRIKSVTGGVDIEDDDVENLKNFKEVDAPIRLPMDDGGWLSSQMKSKVPVKKEVIVKTEPGEDAMMAAEVEQKLLVGDMKKEPPMDNTDIADILKSEEPTLILLQFPDCLPGRGGADDDPPRRKHDEPSTSGDEHNNKPVDNRCRLSGLEEGRVGRLRLHRSGRATLALGDTNFEVCLGTKPSFHQEAVSVSVNSEARSASLVALGDVTHKLTLVPDWESLFCDMDS